jgi:hypothetical protein
MDMRTCIALCSECHQVCLETLTHCIGIGGRHAEAGHLKLLLDCSQMCRTAEDFMLRHSERHALTCGLCAEICERCAESCRQIGGDDGQMERCYVTCRRCAEACRIMSGSSAAR